jgi:DegV family protein with EDD domain
MTVAVLTDSAASLPGPLADQLGITVLPLGLVVGERPLRDGELALEELVAKLDEGVTTAGVAPGEVAAALKERLDAPDVDAAVVLTVSAAMSSTYDAARLGASLLGGPDAAGGASTDGGATGDSGPLAVFDTGTAAGAQGLVVLAAAERAAAGAALDVVVATADRVASQVRLVATVDSLDHLARSGRVPGIAGWAGRHLGVQPLFEFRRGRTLPLRPAFSSAAALDRIIDRCRASRPSGRPGPASSQPRPGPRLHVAGLHALALDRATELLRRATEGEAEPQAFLAPFSTVMVAHTGPGLAGLAWWWEADPR